MTISKELFKTTLENGIKRRMHITWGTLTRQEPIDAVTVSEVLNGTTYTRQKFQVLTLMQMRMKSRVTENPNKMQEYFACRLHRTSISIV